MMTGYGLLDCALLALLSFLFYLVRYKKDMDDPSLYDNSKIISSWSPIIVCGFLAIIAFLMWLAE